MTVDVREMEPHRPFYGGFVLGGGRRDSDKEAWSWLLRGLTGLSCSHRLAS